MEPMSFKTAMATDITAVFLNPDEFSEVHQVNGKSMAIQLDDMENIEREKKMKSHMDGIYARQVFIYVSAEDFGPLPAQGGIVDLDGQKYTVVDATDEAGVYSITLEANRSRR